MLDTLIYIVPRNNSINMQGHIEEDKNGHYIQGDI